MSHQQSEDNIRQVWAGYWGARPEAKPWDSLSELILQTLLRESRGARGCSILEAGCGTGRISHRLAEAGAEVTCLDITQEALDLARLEFGDTPAHFVLGSILSMPRGQHYDLLWNAGVLEHFTVDDQRKALSEFLAVLSQGGQVIILTPYANSPVYRFGKFILEKLGAWPYGVEVPKKTLQDCLPPEARLAREYTMAFLSILFDAYKFLPPLRPLLRGLWLVSSRLLGSRRLVNLDLWLSRWLGGYLLVTILEPNNPRQDGSGA
ncbi:MAG: methyltransferase domain-containing protein [Candidatus Eremiobacteraeota bacterium]|nr:methyltransferase domain-containing protein [Candidatus Eremiobacteraeota bacterium]